MTVHCQTVYIVDDDAGVRNLLQQLVKSMGLAARAVGSAREFLEIYQPAQPACLLLDVGMPGMSGLALQELLNFDGATIPVIFITGQGDVPMAIEAMLAGAFDFLQKPFSGRKLRDSIRRALDKDEEKRAERDEHSALRKRLESLTPREREVLSLVATGRLNKIIAADLNVSPRTVELHRARVMAKMSASSLAQLVRMLIDLKEMPVADA